MRRTRLGLLLALCLVGAWAVPAQADVVVVGDSYISGEAGRWAGNASSQSYVDALGSTAYYDNASNSGEAIPGCHRSKSNESVIGGGIVAKDLACSGATTATQPYSSGSDFKPGLDFYDDGAGHIGQAKALQQYASGHNVKMVVALIGANDYGFAAIVQQCVEDWLLSPSWWPNYCYDDSSISSRFSSSNIAAITAQDANTFVKLRTAMGNAAYADTDWTRVAETTRRRSRSARSSATRRTATRAEHGRVRPVEPR